MNELAEAYCSFPQPPTDSIMACANQALKEANEINYIPGIAKAYQNLARRVCILHDFASAEKYTKMSFAFFMKMRDERQIAWCWSGLGYTGWLLCKFPKAIEAYEKAIQFYEKENDTSALAEIYQQMSFTATHWGRYEKALQYALKCEELTGRENYSLIANFYKMGGDYETALEYFRKTPEVGNGWPWGYLDIGSTFYLKKEYDSAVHYYQLFADYASVGGSGELGKFAASMGEVHLALKRYDSALVYLNNAVNSHKKASDNNQLMSVQLLLANTYKETGAYKRAMQTVQELLQMANEPEHANISVMLTSCFTNFLSNKEKRIVLMLTCSNILF